MGTDFGPSQSDNAHGRGITLTLVHHVTVQQFVHDGQYRTGLDFILLRHKVEKQWLLMHLVARVKVQFEYLARFLKFEGQVFVCTAFHAVLMISPHA